MERTEDNTDLVDDELRAEFIQCAEEHITETQILIMELERRGGSPEILNEIFRHFHSVKADSGIVGAGEINLVAHELEFLLDEAREGALRPEGDFADLLIEGCDYFSCQLELYQEGRELFPAGDFLKKIGHFRNSLLNKAPRGSETVAGESTTSLNEPPGGESTGGGPEIDPVSDEAETTYIATNVIFRCRDVICAIDVNACTEMMDTGYITPLPRVPEYVLGVLNMRGSILPVLDLARRLKIGVGTGSSSAPGAGAEERAKVLIIHAGETHVGLLVDEVLAVEETNRSEIRMPDSQSLRLNETYVNGIIKYKSDLVMLLNIGELLRK